MEQKNQANMDTVKNLMGQADNVRLGDNYKTGVAIDYTSPEGNRYEGTVVFKRPSMKDYMSMGALKAEYLRQAGVVDLTLVDNSIKYMAQVMATLRTLVVKCPEWLMNLENIVESDLLFHIHDKYEEWESSFRKRSEKKPEGTGESSVGTENMGS